MASTALLYAEAGTGKTLLTNSLIKAIAQDKPVSEIFKLIEQP
jgi:tRNA A37 threonylcarbamoyladenosine biosynthesis protein TsaE